MRSVKLLTCTVAGGVADRWYVSTGEDSVGPVSLELLARGLEAGRVPLECFVRNEAWTVWRPLSDVALVTSGDGLQAPQGAAVRGRKLSAAGAARGQAALRVPAPDSEDTFEDAPSDSRPTVPHVQAWMAARPPDSAPSRDSRPTVPRAAQSFS